MPTYEYRCAEGHSFERFYRKMSDAAPELACPQCGKLAERQLTGGAGFVFKGSGFYLTDYGKNAHRKGGPEGKPAEGGGDKPGDGKSSDSGGDTGPASEAKPSPATAGESSGKGSAAAEAKTSKPKSDE